MLCAGEGAAVAVLDRSADAATRSPPRIGGKAFAVDVADPGSVAPAVERAAAAMGGIDGVVNAAGIFSSEGLTDTTPELFNRILTVNITGTFLVIQRRRAVPACGGQRDDREHRIGCGTEADRTGQHGLCRLEGRRDRDDARAGDGTGAENPRQRRVSREWWTPR